MNENIKSNGRPAKVAVVLSIRDLRAMLRGANADSKRSSAHPGKINLKHCVVAEGRLLSAERDFSDGVGHVCSSDLVRSVEQLVKE